MTMDRNRETDPTDILEELALTEYEATALSHLIQSGRTTAPDIAEATGIPQARIYGVLESLADCGFIEVIPGRPKHYQPKPPKYILDRATENRRQAFEDFRSEIETLRPTFLEVFEPMYDQAEKAVSPISELFHVVDVGKPSETETRRLYRVAEREVYVITNSFAYFDSVEPAVSSALNADVDVSVLFLNPKLLPGEKVPKQEAVVEYLESTYPAIEYRFSEKLLPWRGTFVDPSMEYDSGEAIFLVEETDVPDHKRQAAITKNGSFVAGMKRYFDLVWEYESSE